MGMALQAAALAQLLALLRGQLLEVLELLPHPLLLLGRELLPALEVLAPERGEAPEAPGCPRARRSERRAGPARAGSRRAD